VSWKLEPEMKGNVHTGLYQFALMAYLEKK